MSNSRNYVLSKGERLTNSIEKKNMGGPKKAPYSLDLAKERMHTQIVDTANYFDSLPKIACPNDKVVASLTMHPRYISKSDFPGELLEKAGLRAIGGKASYVIPENWGTINHPEGGMSDTWFVRTSRRQLREWSEELRFWDEPASALAQLQSIENFSASSSVCKFRNSEADEGNELFEVILHSDNSAEIVDQFMEYSKIVGARTKVKRLRYSGGVIFVPVRCSRNQIEAIANFSFLRAVRPMPKLRTFRPPVLRSDAIAIPELPESVNLVTDARIAIFDGGLPDESPLAPWVNYIEPLGIGAPIPDALEHGEAVTSAFLFGHLTPNEAVNHPYSKLDHVRVIDEKTGSDGDYEMYDVLDRILNHLDGVETPYKYMNLSLGPDMPIDDDEITAWTSELDQRAANGNMLVTVAAGNSGENDASLGFNRIQPPSDGVNVLSVGACNSQDDHWDRASYSSLGPGRTPGIAKPDGVAFGGTFDRPFGVINTLLGSGLNGTQGTSFSAPFALRSGIGLHAIAGHNLTPLSIRALLVHNADSKGLPAESVGWGRFSQNPDDQITCSDDEVTLIYQGELPLKEYLRASIPLPTQEGLQGMVSIKATLVIAPEVDPAFAHAYTRAGLEVVFRPNTTKFTEGGSKTYASTDTFFSEKNLYKAAEYQLRQDGHKWEPCWRASRSKRGSGLISPCFDIYYHNRDEGRPDTEPRPLPYALVISVIAKREPDFYARTLNAYSEILIPIEPRIEIPVQV